MAAQEITREEIDAALQAFLAKGGVIEKIEYQDNGFLLHNELAIEDEEFDAIRPATTASVMLSTPPLTAIAARSRWPSTSRSASNSGALPSGCGRAAHPFSERGFSNPHNFLTQSRSSLALQEHALFR